MKRVRTVFDVTLERDWGSSVWAVTPHCRIRMGESHSEAHPGPLEHAMHITDELAALNRHGAL